MKMLAETYRFLGQQVCLQVRNRSNLTDLGLVDGLDTAYKYEGGWQELLVSYQGFKLVWNLLELITACQRHRLIDLHGIQNLEHIPYCPLSSPHTSQL